MSVTYDPLHRVTWVEMGDGSVGMQLCTVDGHKFLAVLPVEPGPVGLVKDTGRNDPPITNLATTPEGTVFIYSESIESLDCLILALQELRNRMQSDEGTL